MDSSSVHRQIGLRALMPTSAFCVHCLDVLFMLTHHLYARIRNCLIEFSSVVAEAKGWWKRKIKTKHREWVRASDKNEPRKEHNSQQNRNYVHELVSTITMHTQFSRVQTRARERASEWSKWQRKIHRYQKRQMHCAQANIMCRRERMAFDTGGFCASLQKHRKFASSHTNARSLSVCFSRSFCWVILRYSKRKREKKNTYTVKIKQNCIFRMRSFFPRHMNSLNCFFCHCFLFQHSISFHLKKTRSVNATPRLVPTILGLKNGKVKKSLKKPEKCD